MRASSGGANNSGCGESLLTCATMRVSMAGLGTQAEIASLERDVQRLTELKEFLSHSPNPGNRRRIAEIDEELKRIEKRLAEVA
jgi:hypothetical protein